MLAIYDLNDKGRKVGEQIQLSPEDKRRVLIALSTLPAMRNTRTRQIVVEELLSELGGTIDPTRLRQDLGLLNVCLKLGKVDFLVQVVAIADGQTREFVELKRTLSQVSFDGSG